MRRSFAPVFLVVYLFLVTGCHHPPADEGEMGAPTRDALGRTPADLVEEWVGMWNAYDLDRVGDLFLDADRLTYFSSELEGVIRGYDAVVEHHRGFGFVPGGQDRGTRLWVEGLTEDAFGDAAILTGLWYFQRGEPAAPEGSGGVREDASGAGESASVPVAGPQRGPVTFVCVLDKGRWRFAHMNFGNYPGEGEAGPG